MRHPIPSVIILALAATLLAAGITWNFEGGRLVSVERLAANHYRVAVDGEKDSDGRNRQASWYYFRMDDAPRTALTIDVTGLPGEYNYEPNRGAITGDTAPFLSYDRKTWEPVQHFEYDASEPRLRLTITPRSPTFWIAHVPPYTNASLSVLRATLRSRPSFTEQTIGTSVQGRSLYLWTIGEPSPGKKTVWLMCRQHSWEAPTSYVCEGAVLKLTADDDSGRALRRDILWKILPLNDPDGVARGGVRFNAHGFDLNRNWDFSDEKLMPEIAVQRHAIAQWLAAGHRIDFFLTLHNTETSEYLSGPPPHPDGDGYAALGERVFTALRQKTTFNPSRPFFREAETTTAGKPGRMTVVQGLSRDFHLPAFLMEQRISHNTRFGCRPAIQDRLQFGEQLVRVLAEQIATPAITGIKPPL